MKSIAFVEILRFSEVSSERVCSRQSRGSDLVDEFKVNINELLFLVSVFVLDSDKMSSIEENWSFYGQNNIHVNVAWKKPF